MAQWQKPTRRLEGVRRTRRGGVRRTQPILPSRGLQPEACTIYIYIGHTWHNKQTRTWTPAKNDLQGEFPVDPLNISELIWGQQVSGV